MSVTLDLIGSRTAVRPLSPARRRLALLVPVAVAGALPFVLRTAPVPVDADWLRLLRFMAALKVLFATAALGAVWWRLSAPIGAARLAAYALALGAAFAGPGVIWHGTRLLAGAALLHGGLVASVVLLWRDRAVGTLLAERVRWLRRTPSGPAA